MLLNEHQFELLEFAGVGKEKAERVGKSEWRGEQHDASAPIT